MYHRFVSRILLILPAVLLSIATPVCAQQVLVATSTNLLGVLDFATFTTSGAITLSQMHNVGDSLICMAYDAQHNLYGLDAAGHFYTVDSTQGTLTPLGAGSDIGGGISSAAWDGKTTIYVVKAALQPDQTVTGTLQSVNMSNFFVAPKALGSFSATNTLLPDGFMAVNNAGTIYIGGVDSNPARSPNDAIYKLTPGTSAASTLGLSHLTQNHAPDSNTGYKPITDGVNVNSTLYGFGASATDNSAKAKHSIFTVNTTDGSALLNSYYDVGGGNVTGAVVIQIAGVPEASTLTLMSLMVSIGGGGLLLRRKRARAA